MKLSKVNDFMQTWKLDILFKLPLGITTGAAIDGLLMLYFSADEEERMIFRFPNGELHVIPMPQAREPHFTLASVTCGKKVIAVTKVQNNTVEFLFGGKYVLWESLEKDMTIVMNEDGGYELRWNEHDDNHFSE